MGTVRKLRRAEGVRLGDAIDAYLATLDHPESLWGARSLRAL